MIPAPFDYERAESVEHAVELLGASDDAALLAGGHSLLPLMKLRVTRPSLLVDIGRLEELRYVREDGDAVAIGAATPHDAVARDAALREHCGLVAYAAGTIGDAQVRHRGTIGGSVAHGDPASDLPAVLVALDAGLVVRGPAGVRAVSAGEFFRGPFQTALERGEVLAEVRVPKLSGAGWSYVKFNRRAQDWATVGVAAVDHDGMRVALASMAPTPIRARGVEEALRAGADAAAAAQRAAEGASPPSDVNGSAEYRAHLATVLVRRALEEAGRAR